MKRLAVLMVVLSLLMIGTSAAASIEATTSDGKKVILFPDGRWRYKDSGLHAEGKEVAKPLQATKVLKSRKGFLELWVDPNIWAVSKDINCLIIVLT